MKIQDIKAIDLFAGLGGFSQGARLIGAPVVWAANHWPRAVATHAANHPETDHVCQDLQQADWTKTPACNLLLASPCCQGHSHARGKDRPHHDASRSTAWAVVSCAEYHRPEAVIVENVAEFQNWTLFPAWKQAMEALGYHLTSIVIDAADCGVPQHRRRLFIVGNLRAPVHIPKPIKAHQAIGPHVDWSLPTSPLEKPGRSPKTLSRAANGREAFGDRFVMPYYGSGSGLTGRSLDRPLGTVTTRDRWALVDGNRMRMLQPVEYKAAMGFPEDYQLTGTRDDQVKLLGNAVCPPVAAHVIEWTAARI